MAAIIRFVGFFSVDLEQDVTYYSATTTLLSIAEPGAYFICSTLPYIRPLANTVYHKSGLTTITGTRREGTSDQQKSAPLNAKSYYSATASSAGPSGIDDDRVGFIELVDTVEVRSTRV